MGKPKAPIVLSSELLFKINKDGVHVHLPIHYYNSTIFLLFYADVTAHVSAFTGLCTKPVFIVASSQTFILPVLNIAVYPILITEVELLSHKNYPTVLVLQPVCMNPFILVRRLSLMLNIKLRNSGYKEEQ